MTRAHTGPAAALAAWAALTSWLVLTSWTRLMEHSDGLPEKLLIALALVAAVGVGLRRLGLAWPFTWSGQLLTALLVLHAQLGTSWLPSTSSLEAAVRSVLHAMDTAREYQAPVAADVPSLAPLLLVAGVAIHLVVDLVAVSLRRVLAASLPLLAAWVLPVSVLGTATAWPHFVVAALAWLALLAADQTAERSRWGRTVSAPWLGSVRPGAPAVAIGAIAVLVAVALPSVLPHRPSFTLPGSGPGRGATVALTDPVADLQRNLTRGDDIDLVHITVPQGAPAPAYVRLSVLDEFDGRSWRVGSRSWPQQNVTTGDFPAAPALELPGRRVPWAVEVSRAFASDWLPTPRWVSSLTAGPSWRFDREHLDVHRAGAPGTTAGETYTAVEYLPEITPETLDNGSTAPATGDDFTALPEQRPAWVRDIATEITRDATSDRARAIALQEFFQEEFTYSTATAPGNGFAALDDFLNRSRSGYCEQFAASMALLARELGMPARISVGFLRAERRSSERFAFSAHDLHAWPEIWFRGVGWVGFEPTPTSHTGSVPSWSLQRREATPSASASPTAAPSASPRPERQRPEESAGATDAEGVDWRLPAALGGVLLTGLAACLPRLLRRGQRSRRLGSADVEDWWTELRASVVDLGARWPSGASPRATARRLLPHMEGADPLPPRAALDRLVSSLELARYAPDGHGSATPEDVETCVAALRANAAPRDVRRARWWPRSVTQGRLRSAESA